MEIRLTRAPWYGGVEILVRDGDSIGVNVEMKVVDPGLVIDPTMKVDDTAAQILMDDLWNAGFRPTEGAGSAGSLSATQKHLGDMRKIVSKQLKVEL